jgi:hypothetical protein
MNWFWMNVPLMAVFLGLFAGVPLWLVVRHPDVAPTAPAMPELTTADLLLLAAGVKEEVAVAR